jgi:hypothetical protein
MEYIDRREEAQRKRSVQRNQEDWDSVHNQMLALQRQKLQKKSLEISSPNDPDEQEADQVARSVVSGESAEIHGTGSTINRKAEGSSETTPEFQSKLESSKGGGQSLDDSTKSEMESKMGADFSGVKIHTGSEAQRMSESINAKAFTHGQDVYFKQGEFNTNSQGGKELLAHELVHTVQQGEGKVKPKIQRFGAKTHEGIERHALKKKNAKGQSFSEDESSATYFGNWTRDFNQFLAPGAITDLIGRDVAYATIAFMAALKFNKRPSREELGVYKPSEHIDNPAGTHPDELFQGSKPENQTPENKIKSDSIDEKKERLGLNKNTITGQQQFDVSAYGDIIPKTQFGAPSNAVDGSGVMAYIRDSNLHVETRLKDAAQMGRTEAGFFHFGNALHAIEDLFAHSNYVEIALGKFLPEHPDLWGKGLTAADTKVFDFMPEVNSSTGSRPVLTTGTFTNKDASISLAGEVVDFLDTFNPDLFTDNEIKFTDVQEKAFISLLEALWNRAGVNGTVGSIISNLFNIAQLGVDINSYFSNTPFMKVYNGLKTLSKEFTESLKWLAEALVDIQNPFEYIRKIFVQAILKWVTDQLKTLVQRNMVENKVSETPLFMDDRDQKRKIASIDKYLKEHGTQEQGETTKEFKKRIADAKKESANAVKRANVYKGKSKAELMGPSHSQLAKDHPNSIFFGIAAALTDAADQLLRDKLIDAWETGNVQPKAPSGFSGISIKDDKGGKEKSIEEVVELGGLENENVNDPEEIRKSIVPELNLKLNVLKMLCEKLPSSSRKARMLEETDKLKASAVTFAIYNVYDYTARNSLYNKMFTELQSLEFWLYDKEQGRNIAALEEVIKPVAKVIVPLIRHSVNSLAPNFVKQQKDFGDETGGMEKYKLKMLMTKDSNNILSGLDYTKLNKFNIGYLPGPVQDLLQTSRMILDHPFNSTWWEKPMTDYLAKNKNRVALEVKMRNAGYNELEGQ